MSTSPVRPGSNCCGKPKGCTNMNPGCRYLKHPYKRWIRGEITEAECNAKLLPAYRSPGPEGDA